MTTMIERNTRYSSQPWLASLLATGSVLIWVLTFGACSGGNDYAPPPPPKVTVANPLVQDVVDHHEFTGQIRSAASVEIRARVAGVLEQVHFRDGEVVRAGDLLFTIDPREYEAAAQQAEAEVLNAGSALDFAENDLVRREKAYRENAVSELDVLRARADRDQAKATLAATQAGLAKARIDLSYTKIRSPTAGRVSRHLADEGNLVGYGESTLLTTVLSTNPLHFYFDMNERDFVKYLRQVVEQGRLSDEWEDKDPPEIHLAIAGEESYEHRGVVDYIDNRVDPSTGTIQLRATVDNDRQLIPPGVFARARIPGRTLRKAILVPERALGVDQTGRFLMVLDAKNVVEQRPVQLGPKVDEMRVISKGLSPSDRVVVKGLVRARPGVEVTPETIDLAANAGEQANR